MKGLDFLKSFVTTAPLKAFVSIDKIATFQVYPFVHLNITKLKEKIFMLKMNAQWKLQQFASKK